MKRLVILSSILAVAFVLFSVASGQARRQSRKRPVSQVNPAILTPRPGLAPRINGPKVYGCRPGNPFIYRIPTTGKRPMVFSARKLPSSLALDKAEGIITGTAPAAGEYLVTLIARNRQGDSTRPFKIVSGDTLALTPPMGWNHWYAHYSRITDAMVREAAKVMVSSGMADVGYQYVNIDDCWMNSAPGEAAKRFDPNRVGPARDADGNILPNKYFPDMRALTEFIHSKGLKAGIYTSPGPKTCAGYTASYGHEVQDARQFAEWGFDFLKYDWCSYSEIANGDKSLEMLQKPYRLMGAILREQKRDIVFNLCQYGMGDVWEWGAQVGGNSWRTAGDLGFELNRMIDVALKNTDHRAYSKPGSWNDPDYIQIGYIGDARTGGMPRPCSMSPNEQYAFMSLWCLMAAPLFYSGDMSKLDPFTINVLCNPEVIDIDQDPLGRCGEIQHLDQATFLMVKILEDGSKAVGFFNQRNTEAAITAAWPALGIMGRNRVRDLWRQQDLGVFETQFQAQVPAHGVTLVRISPVSGRTS
jgi:alpha-galactosidase